MLLGILHIVSEDLKMQSTTFHGLGRMGKFDNPVPLSGLT